MGLEYVAGQSRVIECTTPRLAGAVSLTSKTRSQTRSKTRSQTDDRDPDLVPALPPPLPPPLAKDPVQDSRPAPLQNLTHRTLNSEVHINQRSDHFV